MRTAFLQTLLELADRDDRIWLVCGDLGYSVLEPFIERFPERFVNAGVSEQNMAGLAAGLALDGATVFVYSIANFPVMRCLEQVRNDICYHKLDVKIVAVGGGFAYGPAGYTHHGLEDLAVMRAMPNLAVIAPGDPVETRLATVAAARRPGPCYLRLGRGGERPVHAEPPDFAIGRAIWLREGGTVSLISTGGLLEECLAAADLLERQGIRSSVLSMPTLRPIDAGAIARAAAGARLVATVEEHSIVGGLGGAVAEVLAEQAGRTARLIRIGVSQERLSAIGSQAALRRLNGLDAASLCESILAALDGG